MPGAKPAAKNKSRLTTSALARPGTQSVRQSIIPWYRTNSRPNSWDTIPKGKQSCLAMEARGSAKHLSGNENYPLGNEGE